jgi:hypothetical protein
MSVKRGKVDLHPVIVGLLALVFMAHSLSSVCASVTSTTISVLASLNACALKASIPCAPMSSASIPGTPLTYSSVGTTFGMVTCRLVIRCCLVIRLILQDLQNNKHRSHSDA